MSGSSGTGTKGIYSPLIGMQISCTFPFNSVIAYAKVDTNGIPWTLASSTGGSSGWVKGTTAVAPYLPTTMTASWNIGIYPSLILKRTDNGAQLCFATWPNN